MTTTLPDLSDTQGTQSQWAVETHGLTKRFGENIAANDVELPVPRGCAFGYLGPNGAGKTTLIRVLLGLTHADARAMFLLDHAVPWGRRSGRPFFTVIVRHGSRERGASTRSKRPASWILKSATYPYHRSTGCLHLWTNKVQREPLMGRVQAQ
jgi:energy-coupling factor transporter ATP-binding protein EcfA2